MNLTDWSFTTLLGVLTLAAFIAVVILWPRLADGGPGQIVARAGLLLGLNFLVILTAAAVLNAQFLFYADWSDLAGSFRSASKTATLERGGDAAQAASRRPHGSAAQAAITLPPLPIHRMSSAGVITYTVTGPISGLRGQIVVQLPPGYTDPSKAAERYPVLETFQGYPSTPMQWIRTMQLGKAINQEVQSHRMGPVVIISPEVEMPPGTDTECVNGAKGLPQVDTWVSQDVPNWVTHTFRVRTDRAAWATIGLSSGGWCAAMATMLHPAQYSAAIVMAGYFRPEFGPLYRPYLPDTPLASHYNLEHLVTKSPPPVAIWLETSHRDPVSYGSSSVLLSAARPPLAMHAVVLLHSGHRITLWRALLPASLIWLGANVPGFAAQSIQPVSQSNLALSHQG